MGVISPILDILLLFMNVFQTFKTLKPPVPSRNKSRPSIRAITQRKRDMKGLLTMWIVWSCLFAYERSVERFIRVFVPFYGEIKTILLLLLTLTRARSSEPIYLHFIRPTIKPYVSTLDPIVNSLTGACDFVLFLFSIPVEPLFGSLAPNKGSTVVNDKIYPSIHTPEIANPDTESIMNTIAPKPRHALRTASSKATLSTLRAGNGDRRPSIPRRLQSESAANIVSQQFWYPPSPAQSSPESRSVPLPTPSFHFQSASDPATPHQPDQVQRRRGYLLHNAQLRSPSHIGSSSDASDSSDDDVVLETPRKPLGARKRNLSQAILVDEEPSSDECNSTLRTPIPPLQIPRHSSEKPEKKGLGGDHTDSNSSAGPYSAVLSTNGNASSLRTGSSSSSSDTDSTELSDYDPSVAARRSQISSSTLRPSTRAAAAAARLTLNKNSSGTITGLSAQPRRRQPAPGARSMSLSQQQLARMSMSSAAADDENTDNGDEDEPATSSNEQSEFGSLKSSQATITRKAGQIIGPKAKDGKSKRPEEKARPATSRKNTLAKVSTLAKPTAASQAKRLVAPPMATRTSSRASKNQSNS